MSKKFLHLLSEESISFAQNFEDIILSVLLVGVKKGFYIDIGANHPAHDSVTKYFYDRGWRGINIEPNADLLNELKQKRKKDINLGLLVSDKSEQVVEFRQYSGKAHGLSTASELAKKEKLKNIDFEDISLRTTTLGDIISEHCPEEEIDFLKVDVEGLEHRVIKGYSWRAPRPKIVVLEMNHSAENLDDMMADYGYEQVYFDGLNGYFASSEYASSIDIRNNYPKIVLEDKNILSYKTYSAREFLIEKEIRKQNKLMQKNNVLTLENLNIREQLDYVNMHPFKYAAAKFYHRYILRDQKKGDRS